MARKKETWIFHASMAILWLLVVSGTSFCEGAKSKKSWSIWSSEEQVEVEPTTDGAVNATTTETSFNSNLPPLNAETDDSKYVYGIPKIPIRTSSTTPASPNSTTEQQNATTTSSDEKSKNLSTTEATTTTLSPTAGTTSTSALPTTTPMPTEVTSKPPASEDAESTTPAFTLETSTTSEPETTAPTTTPVPNSSSRPSASLAEDYAQDLERHMNTWFAAVDFFQNNLTYNFFNKVESVVDMIKNQTHYLLSKRGNCRSDDLWMSPYTAGPSVFKDQAECLETLKKRDELIQEFFKLVDDFKTTNFAKADKLRESAQIYTKGYAEEIVKIAKYVVPIESVPFQGCVIKASSEPETTPTPATVSTETTIKSTVIQDSSEGFAKDAAVGRQYSPYSPRLYSGLGGYFASLNVRKNVDLLNTTIQSDDKEKDYRQVIRALKTIQRYPAKLHPLSLNQTILPALPEIARRIFNHKLVQLRAQVGPDTYVLTANDDDSITALKVTGAELSELKHASWEFHPNRYEKTSFYLKHESRPYESVCALQNEDESLTGQLRLGKAVNNTNCYWNVNIVCDPTDSSEANEVEPSWGKLDKVNCHVDIRNFKTSNYSLGVNAEGQVELQLFWADNHFDEISVYPPGHQ